MARIIQHGSVQILPDGAVLISGFSFDMEGEASSSATLLAVEWAQRHLQRLAAPTSAAHTGEGGEHGTD